MGIDAEYPAPGYPWPSSSGGAAVGVETELPALDLEREVVGTFMRI